MWSCKVWSCCLLIIVGCTCAHATCANFENVAIPESVLTASFDVLPDGTVAAPRTGLMWMRCFVGQTLTDSVCQGEPSTYNWPDAMAAAHALNFAGHNDWRVPNLKELLSIIDDRCAGPSLNADLFPILFVDFWIWSSTPTAILLTNQYDEVWLLNGAGQMFKSSGNLTWIPLLLVRNLP